jgi:hypothetical protein
MELLEGADISSRAPLPYQEVCRILRDLASAIALLHARCLIHRDLSARNVWLMPDGSVKLIDFGAMAPFGKPANVAGTPPFIAPESLQAMHVDQRTDLYALGALGYYLTTGRHAFPARSIIELPSAWTERPRSVSKRVSELDRPDLPAVPAEFEALIDGLLSHDPLARPTTAADVISRLTVLGALPPTKDHRIAESHLTSSAFVGRSSERALLRNACAAASTGRGDATTVLIESPVGLGRTRLLSEFSLELRLSGVTVLQAEPDPDGATHSVAQKYVGELLNALHATALTAARPYAETLAHLSPALRERLGVERLAEMPSAHGEARMRVQAALRDWFLDIARDHMIVIIADDFDSFDEGSAAWLAGLVHAAREHKLLVVATVTSGANAEAPAMQALRRSAQSLSLTPLSQSEMHDLFRSVFGDAQHLARLVDVVQQRSEGNPGHALDLAEHLTREGVVALEEGTWILPQSVPATALPSSRLEAELARLARLATAARQLGQTLSVHDGSLPLTMCSRLSEITGQALFSALEALVREGVLVGSEGGYRFTRESLRKHLYAELDGERKRRAHRRLGEYLLQPQHADSQLERLRGGVHLLLGGDDDAGSLAVAAAGKHYGLVQLADLGPATNALEVALEHFRERGRSQHELVSLLAPLALGGYYADRRLALRYGWEAVDALQQVVGLQRARKLRPLLGRKLSLVVGLATAAAVFAFKKRNPRIPSFREAIMLLFNCVAALTGACVICLDREAGLRYASVIEPMTALGPKHVASFMHRFCLNLVATISENQAAACEQWRQMLVQLDDPRTLNYLPENVHALYLGGALYARGAIECYRDDSHALECAERLDNLKLKLYDMSADQIRMSYHANRGNREQSEHFRRKVEMHAIQRGTAWQVETWQQNALLTVYLRTGDVAGLKECVQQLARLSVEVPSLKAAHIAALSAYQVYRGTPSLALSVLEDAGTLTKLPGIGRMAGVHARAYNALGEPARAREVCLKALAQLNADDRKFCAMNLAVEIELARAESGVGAFETAEQQLRALLELHAPGANPLTLGALYEALAELAALRNDPQAFETSVQEVARYFRSSRDPALVARHERLARTASMVARRARDLGQPPVNSGAPELLTVVHLLEHGGDHTLTGSAQWALKQLTDLTKSDSAFLFMPQGEEVRCLASIGDAEPSDDIKRFVATTLGSLSAVDDDAEEQTVATDAITDLTRLEAHGKVFQLSLLREPARPANDNVRVIGAVIISGGGVAPAGVLQAIGARLAASRADYSV